MNPKNDTSCAAFPVLERGGMGLELTDTGMTLRDYFAAKALQGLLASETVATREVFAAGAYKMADAMLKAREA